VDYEELARGYFRDYAMSFSSDRAQRLAARDRGSENSALEVVSRGVADASDDAWPMILALVELAPDDAALAYVAAGPLEDLVREHLERFADRLVEQARRDPRFRDALKGVWGWENVDPGIRRRLFDAMGVNAELVNEWERSRPR
jgi:hypothetical protein